MKVSLPKLVVLNIVVSAVTLVLLFGAFPLTTSVHAASRVGTPVDPNIQYVGRWDTSSSSVATSYWGGAYLQAGFTGRTVKIKLNGVANIYVSIDQRADTFYANANGTVNLTPILLAAGTHTLRVATKYESDSMKFQGLVLDAGAKTVVPTNSSKLIEFVGDSVTVGATTTKQALTAYGWLIGEQLQVKHTQIAQSGICLTDAVRCGSPNHIGMITQFFKLQPPSHLGSPYWNFAHYQANVVVINLGTNDQKYGVSDAKFQSNYITFLQKVRAVYPHAIILALEGFKGLKAAPTLAAVGAVNAAGDRNVHYIDTTGWLIKSDFNDSAHPSDEGHAKVAHRLAPIISSFLS